jgi:septum formation topological specificity factor MinE
MIKSEPPQDYWNNYLDELNRIIKRSQERLTSDKFPKDRINYVGRGLASNYLKLTIAHYTRSKKMEVVRKSILEVIRYTEISWDGFWKFRNSKGKVLNQYILSAYDEILWTFSIAYLLIVNDSDFKKLVEVIDKDNIKDDLFEFIIKGKIPIGLYIQLYK